uniref:Peptidase M15C domain-containing protein n=1 Tax=Plectus sambesii TaxID=2011161 RepID=A0A914URT2_9BILA
MRAFCILAIACVAFSDALPSVKDGCPIVNHQPSNFQGKTAQVNANFVSTIDRISSYATAAGVELYITSSFRKDTNIHGSTVVPPASKSNHMVGHAIDMNVVYSGGFCNSVCLSGQLPAPVAAFINKIRQDPALRWGGDFSEPDVVHIDDGLNINNPDEWDREYIQAQKYC